MTLEELKPLLRKGNKGLIPNQKSFIKWDYVLGQMYYIENNGNILTEQELKDILKNRNDLYYII